MSGCLGISDVSGVKSWTAVGQPPGANEAAVRVFSVNGARRRKGTGPKGRRVGRHLRYDPAVVRRWFEAPDEAA
jgi:hypothetical protein